MKRKDIEVVKPNSVAEARGKMSKDFLDLLDISMHEVTKDKDLDKGKLCYVVDVEKYKEKFGLDFSKNCFRKLRRSVHNTLKHDSLISMDFGNGTIVDYFVFQEVQYDESNNTIRVMFSSRFKGILVDLLQERGKKIYYSLPDTLQMNSEYSKRLYPILLEMVHKDGEERAKFSAAGSLQGEFFDRIFEINKFRELLSMPKSYRMNNIRNICSTIIDEIETYTPYHAEVFFNVVFNGAGGRPITHICWTMEEKVKAEENKKRRIAEKEAAELPEYKAIITEFAENHDLDLTLKNISSIASEAIKAERSKEDVEKILAFTLEYMKEHPVETSEVALFVHMMQEWVEPKEAKRKKKSTFLNHQTQNTDYNALVMEELMADLADKEEKPGKKEPDPVKIVEETGADGEELPGQLSFFTEG